MSGNSRVAGWRLEDIDDNLAADFDGSLSGLGVDLSVASYNMRWAYFYFILFFLVSKFSRVVFCLFVFCFGLDRQTKKSTNLDHRETEGVVHFLSTKN